MAFDATTPIGRVRLFIGDAADPSQLPGGEATYAVLLADVGGDEPALAMAAAIRLRAHLAQQVTALGSRGKSLAWANRLKHLDDIIAGRLAYITPGDEGAPATVTLVPVVYRLTEPRDEFSR